MRVKCVEKATKYSPAVHLVMTDTGNAVGAIEKYRDTRTETHPWKAFRLGNPWVYLGAFYDDGAVPDDGHTKYGGKEAAIKAITG